MCIYFLVWAIDSEVHEDFFSFGGYFVMKNGVLCTLLIVGVVWSIRAILF